MEWIIALSGIVIVFFILAYFFGTHLVYGMLKLAQAKLWLTGWVYPPYGEYANKIGSLDFEGRQVQEMTVLQAGSILGTASRPFAALFALGAIVLGFRLILNDPRRKWRREMDALALLERNAVEYPSVRPVIGLNIHKMPTYEGPWRVPEDYIRFSLRHGLIEREITEQSMPMLSRDKPCRKLGKRNRICLGESMPAFYVGRRGGKRMVRLVKKPEEYDRSRTEEYHFDQDRAREVFEEQLGPALYRNGKVAIQQWRQWRPSERAVLAVLLLMAFGPGKRVGREAGQQLLEQFNNSFYHPNWKKKGKPPIREADLDMTGVDQVIAGYLGIAYKPRSNEGPYDYPAPPGENRGRDTIQKVRLNMGAHGYMYPWMVDLLQRARQRGVLITADMIWLRPVHRTLFYTLNNVGRNNIKNANGLVEGAGGIAHFMVEETLGHAALTPEVDEAVKGLEKGLISEGWLPHDEEED